MTPGSGAEAVSTRERILDAALDLFLERGYDKASLREVAEAVGVTKAALYYHFPSKEDILRALMEQAHGVGHHLGLDVLVPDKGPLDLAQVSARIEGLLGPVLAHRRIFLLMERNHAAVDALGRHEDGHDQDHELMEQRLMRVLTDPGNSVETRVRFSAAVGVLMAAATMGGALEPPGITEEQLQIEFVKVVRDLLRQPRRSPRVRPAGPRPVRATRQTRPRRQRPSP